jgi:CubicO group peptidase (beta-lactamase class C family)
VELAVPATADTVYELASVTKQFTATAVMMLVEEGKIGLDDRITQRLDGLPSAWGDVRIRHLLSHTSGIKSYSSIPDFFKTARKDYTKEELLQLVAGAPLDFPPGEKWSYSNTGYFLLGMLIEKVTGKSYGAFLHERIFQPLGMTSTQVNDLTQIIKNRATGYTWQGDRFRNGEYVSPTQPFAAGALVSTVRDMAKWDAALYADRLLKRSSLARMWTPVRLNDGQATTYGFGWQTEEYRTRRRISHSGGIPGFSTEISRFVDDHLTVIVLANSDSADAGSLATGVAAFYLPALVAHAPKPIRDTDPKTTQRLRDVMTAIAAGHPDPQSFTEPAKAALFPGRMEEAKSILGPHGPLQSFELMEERSEGKQRVRSYKAAWKDLTLRCSFTLTEAGQIDALNVRPE